MACGSKVVQEKQIRGFVYDNIGVYKGLFGSIADGAEANNA